MEEKDMDKLLDEVDRDMEAYGKDWENAPEYMKRLRRSMKSFQGVDPATIVLTPEQKKRLRALMKELIRQSEEKRKELGK